MKKVLKFEVSAQMPNLAVRALKSRADAEGSNAPVQIGTDEKPENASGQQPRKPGRYRNRLTVGDAFFLPLDAETLKDLNGG